MARIKARTMANYFQKNNINAWRYVKDGLNCWTKSTEDFECKVECPYNERKAECGCHTQVCKDALDYINELEAKLADVAPKSEVDMSQHLLKDAWKRIEELDELCGELQKAKAEVAREIFEEIEKYLIAQEVETEQTRVKEVGDWILHNYLPRHFAELKKKYTEGKE